MQRSSGVDRLRAGRGPIETHLAARVAGSDVRGHAGIQRSVRPDGGGRGPSAEFLRGAGPRFLGDGGAWIWTLQRTYFPTFEPIVDFVHVLSYVYLAAKAAGGPATCGLETLSRLGDGLLARASRHRAGELRVIHETMPPPEDLDGLKSTEPYEVIRLTIGYLTNNEPRMDYPRYRRAGLPTCSSLVESLIKQFNRRVKGTEKFWNPSQAETILQLRRGLPL